MSLASIYKSLRPSLVAFIRRYAPIDERSQQPPLFPPIIGTGFVVHEDGLVVTNAHVARAFSEKPKGWPEKEWPVRGILLRLMDKGQAEIPLDILGVVLLTGFEAGRVYYGPKEGPDLALVHVNVKGLPALKLDTDTLIQEGMEVATAGFPMGTDAFTAPGWLHQVTPTLQRGIVSAVLPFSETTKPHAFSIDVMTQGGASGSPVVSCDTGRVLGVVHSGLFDIDTTLGTNEPFRVPTSISYAVPSHYVAHVVAKMAGDAAIRPRSDTPHLEEMLASAAMVNALESGRGWKTWPPSST